MGTVPWIVYGVSMDILIFSVPSGSTYSGNTRKRESSRKIKGSGLGEA